MKVKITKEGVLLEGKNASMLNIIDTSKIKKLDEVKGKADLVLAMELISKDLHEPHFIDKVGEYEVKDILVHAISQDNNNENIDIAAIDIDEVKVILVSKAIKKVEEKVLDQFGLANILIIDIDESDLEFVEELVAEIEPNVLIPITDKADRIDALGKSLGVQLPEGENYQNFDATEFDTEEDTAMRIVLLNSK